MMNPSSAAVRLTLVDTASQPLSHLKATGSLLDALGVRDVASHHWLEQLPFGPADVSAGVENELQAVVAGRREDADLAQAIETSNYYKNVVKRVASGDAPKKTMAALERYLGSSDDIWENSWVRLPVEALNTYAKTILENDLLADKSCCDGPCRHDRARFFVDGPAGQLLRIPISYLLKLSLAQAIGLPDVPLVVRRSGEQMLDHFLNDNTSPETHSFAPVGYTPSRGLGHAVVKETLLRYLLTQLVVQYANRRLGLAAHGQRAIVHFAPHPPSRQKQLNDLISDAFYRELFMSPCLSGWDRGEAKHRYMVLCHEVLSRSQLNTIAKLKEAGIIANNLVVLPCTSNICLANNGTHLSLGSRTLTRLMADGQSGFGEREEKYYGDLVIKICEHFLPLFVGTYSAAPYRLDYWDFHPEKVLGFLPHQLDYTHLRMIWRRWKGKAGIKFFGQPVTPFGPPWLDRALSRLLALRGDLVHDFRLIDYMVSLLSTDESPSLDGTLGNDKRLKADLADMGVFDRRMPLYMLMRLRPFNALHFSGFENRHYSLFEGFDRDMRPAVDLQQLTTMLAYHYMLQGTVTHADIPDNPTLESERRQFFFGAAIGIPTLYLQRNSGNRLMHRILKHCRNMRRSRRYTGYLRVPAVEYQRALIRLLRHDGRQLIEMLGLAPVLDDLEQRIDHPQHNAVAHRIVAQITGDPRRSALKTSGQEFNRAAEAYYREDLRQDHMQEAYSTFCEAVAELDSWQSWRSGAYNRELMTITGGQNAVDFLNTAKSDVIRESLPPETCQKLISLLLLTLHHLKRENGWT